MSAGMAYEAMNNAKQAGNRLIVILNDNDMSIAPPVGGLSAYLARLVSSRPFLELREIARSEENTSELRSLMLTSSAVFCLNKKTHERSTHHTRPCPARVLVITQTTSTQ